MFLRMGRSILALHERLQHGRGSRSDGYAYMIELKKLPTVTTWLWRDTAAVALRLFHETAHLRVDMLLTFRKYLQAVASAASDVWQHC